jgi:hypothetical protein
LLELLDLPEMINTQKMLQISAGLGSEAVPDQMDLAILVPASRYTIRKRKHLAAAYLSEEPWLVCFLMRMFVHEVL